MTPILPILAAALFPQAASHAEGAPPFLLERAQDRKAEIKATPPAGFHFNTKAPMMAFAKGTRMLIPVRVKGENEVRIGPIPSRPLTMQITLYLCDQANTLCEKKVGEFPWDGKATSGASSNAQAPSVTPRAATPKSIPHPKGFILNEPEKALALAKKKDLPLFIDFFGIWCPPCNDLDTHVFSTQAFQAKLKGFVALKVDADDPVSWPLKSKFKVSGYPTLVFASPRGEELFRVVGTRELSDLLKAMSTATKFKHDDLPTLTAQAPTDPVASGRLGEILLERHEYAEARAALARAVSAKAEPKLASALAEADFELAAAAIEAATGQEQRAKRQAQLATAERLIAEHPTSPYAYGWIDGWTENAEALEDAAATKKAVETSLAWTTATLQTPERLRALTTDAELTRADLLVLKASLLEKQSPPSSEPRRAWKEAALEYQRRIDAAGGPIKDRGNALEYAYCLRKSGEGEAARTLYTKLAAKYDDEFTFFFAHASFEKSEKRWDEAARLGRRALEKSYGDNKLRSALLLAQVLKEAGKAAEAESVIAQTLASLNFPAALPSDPSVRTHRHYETLVKFRESLAKGT